MIRDAHLNTAFDKGYDAYFLRGESRDNNPYLEDEQPDEFEAWQSGWWSANSDAE